MKRHIVTALFLVVAIGFYALGAAGPGTVFLIAGGLFEVGFWLMLFGRGK